MPSELLDTMVRRRGQWFLPEEYGHTQDRAAGRRRCRARRRAAPALGSHGQMQGLGAHWETVEPADQAG